MKQKAIPSNNSTFQIPLLQAKLQMPRALPGLVERSRIHACLDKGLQGKLILLKAPAGFGKTTAMAEWVRQRGLPAAWLSLDRDDNDPVRFWNYTAAALGGLQKDIGVRMMPLLCSSSAPWEAVLSLLIDDLTHLTCDFALVLDDYHVISEPLVQETVSFLVRYAPGQFHLIIAGRTEPRFSLSRLRAAGQVVELTERDLIFAKGEIASFYRHRNIKLTGEEIEKLSSRTGGWAAGMQMAALSLLESDNKAVIVEGFGGRDRFLAGYFLEEVFEGLGAYIQEFLLQTSILSHLSGPLCEAVTGKPDSSTVLDTLGKTCGFVASLDEQWYVYHHLFAEFLVGLLKERYPGQIRCLYANAARWYADNGLTAQAVECYLQGEEYVQAADLVEQLVLKMLNLGETTTLFRWLQVLPPEAMHESPALCVAQAWAEAASYRIAEVEQWLVRAHNACCATKVKLPEGGNHNMAVDIAVLRAYLAVKRRDVLGTLHWLTQAVQVPERNFTYGRCVVLRPLGTSLLGGPLGWFGRLKEKSRAMESGVFLKFLSLAEPTARAGYAMVANAEALYEWNKIEAAEKSLVVGIEEAQRAEEAGALIPAWFTLAKIHWARGDLTAALKVAAEGEKEVQILSQLYWLFPLAALKARINLAAGDTRAVGTWLAHNRLEIYDHLSTARAYEHITLVRILLARGQAEEALLLLKRLQVFAEKEEWLPLSVEVGNLLAIACDTAGRTAEGLEILRGNLVFGRDNGYLRSFVDEGEPLLVLLRRLSRSRKLMEDEANYVGQLLILLRESPVLRYPGLQIVSRYDSLTTRELAVLRFAAMGLDNRTIAKEMSIGGETVKTYLARVYAKLGVDGRRNAVKRAQELGILSPGGGLQS